MMNGFETLTENDLFDIDGGSSAKSVGEALGRVLGKQAKGVIAVLGFAMGAASLALALAACA